MSGKGEGKVGPKTEIIKGDLKRIISIVLDLPHKRKIQREREREEGRNKRLLVDFSC